MKNGAYDMNENVPDIDQALHEKLCAYVFDELQGAERAAFEAELLRSPALQAERARLVATIGLVKRAVPDEGLSLGVRRDLVASARRSRFRILSGRNIARLAVAAVLVLGGVMVVRMATDDRSPYTYELYGDVKVAEQSDLRKAERNLAAESVQAPRGRDAEALEALRGLGYSGGGAESAPAAPQAAQESLTTQEVAQLEAIGSDYSTGGTPIDVASQSPPQTLDLPELADKFRYGETASVPAVEAKLHEIQPEADVLRAELAVAGTAGPTSPGAAPAAGPAGSESYGTGTPSAFASRRAGGAGRPGLKQAADGGRGGTRDGAAQPFPLTKGEYRGPGDSVPPATYTWRDTRAAAPGEGSDGFFLGHGQVQSPPVANAPTESERQLLDKLGYAGADDADETRKDQDSFRSRREPVQSREQVVAQVEELLRAPRIAPGETPGDMFFRYWGDGPFVLAAEQKLSTFAVDVDTASYALARSYLNQGSLPPRESVRTEEFVNYFKADQPPPTDGRPFAIGLELAPSLFAKDPRAEMLRVTVRGKEVADFERQSAALTFVIDNSGSMAGGGRLELVKRSLALLLRELGAGDSVAVVKFSNSASVVTESVAATRRGELESLIQGIATEGGTNVEGGLRLGYELALRDLQRNAVNRVILCSDGVGNIGETSAKGLVALVRDAREKGIYLNTVGVGMGNHDDAFLEQLADHGDGLCNYVDSDAEAKRVFIDGLASAIQPIARDVKIQVELDPAQVESWRLLGYENRALRTQDFRDDAIDAGEVNAGHQVTALYEIVRLPTGGGPLATVRVRYKPPFAIDHGKEGERERAEAEQALEIERSIGGADARPGLAGASSGYQRAVLVAQFAEVLRQSVHARGDDLATLVHEAQRLAQTLADPDFTEFVALLAKANPLLDARSRIETPKVQPLLDELAQLHFDLGQAERRRQLQTDAARSPEELEERLGALGEGARERDEVQRREAELRARILRLEGEVRDEILRSRGLDPEIEQQLKDIGYGGKDE